MVDVNWSTIEIIHCFIQNVSCSLRGGGPGGLGGEGEGHEGGGGREETQEGWQGDTDWGPVIICN